jgi:hypothetical protein
MNTVMSIAIGSKIANLHDKTIKITTIEESISRGHADQSGRAPGMAGGADFVVPPGYPNDSYPLRVQSGERVVVTPAN